MSCSFHHAVCTLPIVDRPSTSKPRPAGILTFRISRAFLSIPSSSQLYKYDLLGTVNNTNANCICYDVRSKLPWLMVFLSFRPAKPSVQLPRSSPSGQYAEYFEWTTMDFRIPIGLSITLQRFYDNQLTSKNTNTIEDHLQVVVLFPHMVCLST